MRAFPQLEIHREKQPGNGVAGDNRAGFNDWMSSPPERNITATSGFWKRSLMQGFPGLYSIVKSRKVKKKR
jgi:hypothetical protein